MTDNHNRRTDDARLERILDKLEEARIESVSVANALKLSQAELQTWQTTHKTWCLGEFNRIDRIMAPIKEAYELVDRPARWVGRIMVLTFTGALVWIGSHIASWIAKHFN